MFYLLFLAKQQWRNPWVKLIIVSVLCIVCYMVYESITAPEYEQISLLELINKIENKEIEKINIATKEIYSSSYSDGYNDIKEYQTFIGSDINLVELLFDQNILNKDNQLIIEYDSSALDPYLSLIQLLVWVIVFSLMGYVFYKQMGPLLYNTRFDPVHNTGVVFDDVAGVDDCKIELKETIEFLKNPKEYNSLGARVPKGVLLAGPPGTGKTLLARAVAGEAGVPFYNISGSDFVEMFVGLGASRVRTLFKKAKNNSPCIIFIDEIDAIGGHRGTATSHGEREQTLNQILVEMDGFNKNHNVVIMAATNRQDTIDPALIRPGRFDRIITLDLPNTQDRIEILEVHTKEKPLSNDVNLHNIARQTYGFSGAELSNLSNEASILAKRKNNNCIATNDFSEAIERVITGSKRSNNLLSDKNKKIVAHHEAGHAFVAHTLPDAYTVHKISIVPRGNSGGHTMLIPNNDDNLLSKNQLLSHISVMLAGRASEHVFFGEITTGSDDDIKKATILATNMVKEHGMLEEFKNRYLNTSSDDISYSLDLHKKIDNTIDKILDDSYKQSHKIIFENKELIQEIAEYLIINESISEIKFNEFINCYNSKSKNIVVATV